MPSATFLLENESSFKSAVSCVRKKWNTNNPDCYKTLPYLTKHCNYGNDCLRVNVSMLNITCLLIHCLITVTSSVKYTSFLANVRWYREVSSPSGGELLSRIQNTLISSSLRLWVVRKCRRKFGKSLPAQYGHGLPFFLFVAIVSSCFSFSPLQCCKCCLILVLKQRQDSQKKHCVTCPLKDFTGITLWQIGHSLPGPCSWIRKEQTFWQDVGMGAFKCWTLAYN